MIRDMILDVSLKQRDMADAAGCSDRTIRNLAANVRAFGSTKAPANGAGRRRVITPPMLAALCDRLLEKPGMYRDEMAACLYDEFDITVSLCSIGRALASIGWTKKVTRRIANERNADLRDFYMHKLSEFRSYQLVYIDESGCDKRVGYRRTGWSPVGVAPER
jgi:transposase